MGSEVEISSDGTRGPYHAFFKKTATTDVVPARKTDHAQMLNPSHLDHLHMDRYVPLLLFYQLADNADPTYQRFVDNLKSSLAETLVAFYPMAGRALNSTTTDPDHPRQFLLNDRGIPFSEAVLDSDMAPFVGLPDFQPIGYLSGFEPAGLDAFKQVQVYHKDGIAPAFVQVTRFNCGGLILAFSWNHMLADMTAAVQFLTAWSDISRTGRTSINPVHDRSSLSSETPHSSSATPPPAISSSEAAKIQRALTAKFSAKSLHIRREAIAKLKQEALQTQYSNVSTMDCLCAHIWRSLAKVYSDLGITDTTVFTTAVEGRGRMQVSPDYFGNVVASASVMGIPAADITSKPVSYAASLIRKAVTGITKETYWSIIEQMDLRNPWKTSINRTDYQLGVASWVRFGLNDLDFGIGKPTYVGVNLPAQNSRKGQCIILPSAAVDGDFFVLFYLSPHILDALWANPEFTSVS